MRRDDRPMGKRQSISGQWTGKYQSYDSPISAEEAEEEKQTRQLIRAKRTVGRTVYVLGTGTQKGLTPEFASTSDVKQNNLYDRDKIFLDSGPVLNPGELSDDERTDVLCGDALFGAACKETIDNAALYFRKALDGDATNHGEKLKKRKPARDRIFNALESRKAVEYIRDRAPGYEGYLQARVDYRHSEDTQEEMERIAADPEVRVNDGAGLIAHVLNDLGNHPINITNPTYQSIIDDIERALPQLETVKDRLMLAENISSRLQEIEEEQDGEGDGSGNGDGDGDGDGDGQGEGTGPAPTAMEAANSALTGEATQEGTNQQRVSSSVTYEANKDGGKDELVSGKMAGRGSMVGKTVATTRDIDRAAYPAVLSSIHGQIQALRNSLRFRDDELSMIERGLRDGEIDEDSLYKLSYRPQPGEQPTIFERKEILAKPGIQIAILCDESGSMASIIGEERKVAATIAEALRGMTGVDLRVYGYGDTLKEVIGPNAPPDNFAAVCQLSAYAGHTPTAEAIRKTAYELLNDGHTPPDVKSRMIFVLSDGSPANGPATVTDACEITRKHGVSVFGIGIASAYSQEQSDIMYGQGHGVVIQDVASAGRLIGTTITRLMEKLGRD